MRCLGFALLVGAAAFTVTEAAAVSPVEKVIQLMTNLVATLEAEAKAEAEEYNEFSCWCKNEADNKIYAVETSKKKQKALAANIEKLTNQISKLDEEVSELDSDIDTLTTDKTNAQKDRQDGHEKYQVVKADYELCIRNAEEAKRDVHAKNHGVVGLAALVQVKKLVKQSPIKADGSVELIPSNLEETIDKVKQMCVKKLQDTEEKEYKDQSEHDLQVQAMDFKLKMKTKESKEKAALSESKTAEKERDTEEKANQESNMKADEKFLKEELTTQCESRAEEYHARVEERNTEISKLTEAKEVVEKGVQPNYGANKKLVDLQTASRRGVPALVQIRGSMLRRTDSRARVTDSARRLLAGAAERIGSTMLSKLAAKVGVTKNFDKIQSLIADLVEKLEDEQDEDNAKKAECDALATEAGKRDDANAAIERNTADSSRAKTDIARLKRSIANLNMEVADLQTALSENTEMTQTQKDQLAKDKKDAEEGLEAVENAIKILGGDGGEYDGNAGGDAILGMLTVICDDFKRTIDTVNSNVEELESKFDEFSEKTTGAVNEKTDLKEKDESELEDAKSRLETATDSKADEKENLENALGQIKALEPGCTDQEDYATRAKEREQEIEALKDARSILDGWKDF